MSWPHSRSRSPPTTLKCPCCSGNLKLPLQANQQVTSVGVELGCATCYRRPRTANDSSAGPDMASANSRARSIGGTRRGLLELINHEGPAWPLVQRWMADATNPVELLPAPVDVERERALYETQVTTRSPMGAVLYESGGLFIDHGWIGILGAGHSRLPRAGCLAGTLDGPIRSPENRRHSSRSPTTLSVDSSRSMAAAWPCKLEDCVISHPTRSLGRVQSLGIPTSSPGVLVAILLGTTRISDGRVGKTRRSDFAAIWRSRSTRFSSAVDRQSLIAVGAR